MTMTIHVGMDYTPAHGSHDKFRSGADRPWLSPFSSCSRNNFPRQPATSSRNPPPLEARAIDDTRRGGHIKNDDK